MKKVAITTETIALDQLLKWEGIVASGGAAKQFILGGDIWVNGTPCTVIRKQLTVGDRVDIPDIGTLLLVRETDED